jgi:HlyD family secretion protein
LDTITTENKDNIDFTSASDSKKDEVEVVFVSNNNVANIRKVTTGIQDDKLIVITNGLQKGDKIISGPYAIVSKSIKHGDKIKHVSKETLFEVKK